MKRPFPLYILCLLHLFLGISAAVGGAMLVLKTDGSLLGMQPGLLGHSPFSNYLIPGLILFFLVGIFSLFIFSGLLFKPKLLWANALNLFPRMHWSWTYSLYAGIMVIIWIVFQMVLTQYFWLQPVIISIGLLIIIFTMIPSTIKHFRLEKKNSKTNENYLLI